MDHEKNNKQTTEGARGLQGSQRQKQVIFLNLKNRAPDLKKKFVLLDVEVHYYNYSFWILLPFQRRANETSFKTRHSAITWPQRAT